MSSNTSFPTRPLGRTGMAITRIGLGAWAIGGNGWAVGWGPQDDTDSIEAIRRAVERGINWIDTAAVYGLGHSEEIVRRALAQMPLDERPYVFTKCGLTWSAEQQCPGARARRPASAGKSTARCGAWGWNASISTRCTGPPATARRWKRTGRNCWT
jgi:aryl-alcohol dehydrogenase-like predicted oxidoreductase